MSHFAIEVGNLFAGLHPRDVKRHGYTLTRVVGTLRLPGREVREALQELLRLAQCTRHSAISVKRSTGTVAWLRIINPIPQST